MHNLRQKHQGQNKSTTTTVLLEKEILYPAPVFSWKVLHISFSRNCTPTLADGHPALLRINLPDAQVERA